jgi:four helix bundle protein
MAKLEMYDVALQLIASLQPLHAALRKSDRAQAQQLKDAANSVVSNIAEGARRHGRDRIQHWLIAAGSADEVRAEIQASLA